MLPSFAFEVALATPAKGLGYVAGPIVGGGLVVVGGYNLLFALLATLALIVAAATAVAVPTLPTKPKARQTGAGLVRRLSREEFVRPVVALAAATAALSAAVGFLPVVGARAHLGPVATGCAVSVLAAFATLVQPKVGRALDSRRLQAEHGMALGLAATAIGFVLAVVLPAPMGLAVAAVAVGCGVGVVTPLGFAELALRERRARPWERPKSGGNWVTPAGRCW